MSIRATAQYTITDLNDATEIVKDFYGESSTLIKSGNSNFKEFNLLGNSKQKTRDGKNLINLANIKKGTINGITCKYNSENNSVTFNGTCTTTNTLFTISDTSVQSQYGKTTMSIHYVSGTCESGESNPNYPSVRGFDQDWRQQMSISNLSNLNSTKVKKITAGFSTNLVRWDFRFEPGNVLNNFTVQLMVTEDVDTEYEQYGVSPSIDYPSENKSVGDNKNLIIETSDNLWYNTDTNLLITSSNVVSAIAKIPKNCDITISKKNGSNRFVVLTCTNKPVSGVAFKQIFIDNGNLNRKTYTFKNTDGEYLWIGLCNSTVNEDRKKALEEIKVETGTIATSYSPFGNGNISINICNKNLIDYKKLSLWQKIAGWKMTTIKIDNDIIKFNNTKAWDVFSIYDKRFINKKISITGEIRYTKKSDNFWGVIVTTNKYSDYPKINPPLNTWTEFSHTITSNGYIGFCIRGKDDDTVSTEIEIRNIAISFDNPIEYIPHEEQNYTIDTQEPFRAINDIRDCFILKEDDKWYERHNVARYILTGKETVAEINTTKGINYFKIIIPDLLTNFAYIDEKTIQYNCNYFKAIKIIDRYKDNTMFINIDKNLIICSNNFTTIDELKTKLVELYNEGTPVYVDYVVTTPIDIECTSRQQEQLDILTKNSYTYEDTTILSSIDEIPSILSGKYYTYYKGNLSVGVRTVKVDYQVSSNGVDIPTGTWESQIPLTQPSQFLWTRTTTYFTDNTTKVSYSISRNGTNGTTARTYWLSSSTSTVNRSMSKILKPSTITFNSYYRDGTSATNTSYAGRFIIQESSDGKSWTTKYTSSANESSKTYTPTNTTSIVKCTMYVAGGTTTALDTTTVNIVDSIDDLQIGGKNLWLNSANISAFDGITGGAKNIVYKQTDNSLPCKNYFKFTTPIDTNKGNCGGWFTASKNVGSLNRLVQNEIYTLSFYIKADVETGLVLSNLHENQTSVASSSLLIKTTWTKMYATYKWTNTERNTVCFYVTKNATQENNIYISSIKLEKGNKPTDWTPAPEDVDSKIDNISVGGRNLFIKKNLAPYNLNSYSWNNYTLSCSGKGNSGINLSSSLFTVGETYVLSFKFKKTGGTLESIGGHMLAFKQLEFCVDNVILSDVGYSTGYTLEDTTDTHTVYVILKYNGNTDNNNLYIQVNRSKQTAINFDIWDIELEKGNKPTDWMPAPEDVDSKIDNIQVGGRNLALGTSNEWSDWISLGEGTNKCKTLGIVDLAKLGLKYGDSLAIQITFEGADYTSLTRFYTQGTVNKSWSGDNWFPNPWNSKLINVTSIDVMNKVNKYTYIYNFPNSSIDKINSVGGLIELGIRQDGANAEAKFRWKELKVEIGNKLTDWSPAPEDVENEILQRPTQGAVTDQISQSLKNATKSIDQTIAEKIDQSRIEIDNSTDKKIEAANKSVKQEINSTTGEKIRDLEYFASQMTLKGNEFSIGIEKTKGVNLIKNSVMKQHKERGGSGANSKNIKANFWLNNSLSEDYFPNIVYGEDSLSRSNTDSGNYFRFNLVSSSNTQLDYIFSDPIDFKKNTSNIILSYKLRQMQKITNGVFFIGLVFYRQDTSATGMGTVSKTVGIPTSYYVPVTEYSSTDLTGSFFGDYIYKTMPITRQGNIKVEETIEVKETISNGEVTEKYINLTYTPSSSNPTVNILSYGSEAIEHFKATNKKVVLRLADTRKVVTVQYTRDLQNFVAMDSPTDAKIKTALANVPISEVTIYYNSSNKKIWTYNPFTGAFIETSNLYDTTVTDTNINTVRVVMGVRSTNSSAITGQIDISDVKLEYDSVSTIWTQNVGETYSKQYKMDEKGFSISSDTNTMFIDEDEIAAYKSDENGELDMNNPVFQIKEDETILRQTTIYDQLNIENTNETRADAFVMKQQLIGGKWYFIFY